MRNSELVEVEYWLRTCPGQSKMVEYKRWRDGEIRARLQGVDPLELNERYQTYTTTFWTIDRLRKKYGSWADVLSAARRLYASATRE